VKEVVRNDSKHQQIAKKTNFPKDESNEHPLMIRRYFTDLTKKQKT
jgi:hypothetical protein